MVLANLEQLQIRALFSQLSSSVSLRRVVLEMATDTATGVRASNVELCFCPANYQGDSCQVEVKGDVVPQAEGGQTATVWDLGHLSRLVRVAAMGFGCLYKAVMPKYQLPSRPLRASGKITARVVPEEGTPSPRLPHTSPLPAPLPPQHRAPGRGALPASALLEEARWGNHSGVADQN